MRAEKDRLRFFSSIFSRSFFLDLLENEGVSEITRERLKLFLPCMGNEPLTLGKCLKTAYMQLAKSYRSEYVYKNALIRMIVEQYSRSDTVIFNEFKCGRSYADIAMFNGKSRVYEIKTELDSPARLAGQLKDYKQFFEECYIVTHDSLVDKYAAWDDAVGIISLSFNGRKAKLRVVRSSGCHESFNSHLMMRLLHTSEYIKLTEFFYGSVPDVSAFDMFSACSALLSEVSQQELQKKCNELIKRRKTNSADLWSYSNSTSHLLQILLALHINPRQYGNLKELLTQPIL